MVKKITCFASLLLLLSFYPLIGFGQCWRVHYCKGCVDSHNCDEYRDFNNESDANTSLKMACATGGYVEYLTNCGYPQPKPNPVNIKSPGANGVIGGILGGLIGSFGKDPNGKVLWDLGAAGGFAFFSILTTIAVPKSRAMGPSILLGAINGAATGYTIGRGLPLLDKSNIPKPPDEVTKQALIGAVVGGGGGALIGALAAKKKIGGSTSRLIRRSKLLSNMAFAFSGSRLGIVVRL